VSRNAEFEIEVTCICKRATIGYWDDRSSIRLLGDSTVSESPLIKGSVGFFTYSSVHVWPFSAQRVFFPALRPSTGWHAR